MLDEAVPGNIRKAEHFIAFLKRFIEYLKVGCSDCCSSIETDEADENAGSARCGRNAAVFPRSPEGDNLHRA